MVRRALWSFCCEIAPPGRAIRPAASVLVFWALLGWARAADDVLLTVTHSGGDVELQWTGGVPVYAVFRSEDPTLVIGLPTKLGETSGGTWPDAPPPEASILFYNVTTGACGTGGTSCGGLCADLATDVGNCGFCDWICGIDTVLPHAATYACAGGECIPGSCEAGWADCIAGAGCETQAPLNTGCETAVNLGIVWDWDGLGSVEVIRTGQVIIPGTSRWYRVLAADPPGDDWKLLTKAFNITAGVDLDLYAYRRSDGNTCSTSPPVPSGSCNQNISGCGSGQENSNRCSTSTGNASECVSWFEGCTGFLEDDETVVWVEVRHVSGGCGTFDFKIRNNGNNDSLTCANY